MISYNDALLLLRKHPMRLNATQIDSPLGLGQVIAKDIAAPIDLPPFDNAAVDGFAVRAESIHAKSAVPIMVNIRAQGQRRATLKEGMAARIMTGAPIPKGANAVVMKEQVTVCDQNVLINTKILPKDNVRLAGEDIKRGELVCKSGTVISPQLIGVLCGLGIYHIKVFAQPRVRILSTGDELLYSNSPLRFGQAYYLVGPMLKAQCQALHVHDVEYVLIKDDERAIADAVYQSMDADLILLTGGMSKGDYDLVRPALKKSNVKEIFYQGAWRPGKPLFFGEKGPTKIFGLPGNPVAAFVCFHVFIRPFLLNGWQQESSLPISAPLTEGLTKKPGLTYFARATLNGKGELSLLLAQGSHQIFNLFRASALAMIPAEKGIVKAGEIVHYLPI